MRRAITVAIIGVLLVGADVRRILAQERPGDRHVRARAAAYEPAIAAAAVKHGVDPRILWTIAYLETRFRPRLTSPAGAGGLCQLMPGTAARFGVTDRYDALQSIEGAAKYVRFLSRTFQGNLDLILAGYNAGEGAVIAFRDGRSIRLGNGKIVNPRRITTGGVPPYRETRQYVALGRQIFDGVERARVFSDSRPYRSGNLHGANARRLQPTNVGAPPVAARQTRSIYLADGGTPLPRALDLPQAGEIAAVFSEAAAPPGLRPGQREERADTGRSQTQSIRFE